MGRPTRYESAEDKAFRHEACKAMGLPLQTRTVTCAHHGVRADVTDPYEMNNWAHEAGGGLTCAPDHPHCWKPAK